MIVMAFVLFAALVLAWLAAPGKEDKRTSAAPAPAYRPSEAAA